MTFCAVCTSDRGPFVARPLGRNDALVSVCVSCDSDTPRARRRRPIERGYQPAGGLLSRAEIDAGGRRLLGDEGWRQANELEVQSGMSPSESRIDEHDAIAFRIETSRRIKTKANEHRGVRSAREGKVR